MSDTLSSARASFRVDPKEKRKPSTLFFGVELEVEARANVKITDVIDTVKKYDKNDVFIVTTDALTNGREFVSQPMTWRYLHSSFPWEMFVDLNKIAESYDSAGHYNAGFHLHLSQAAFTTDHLFRFLKFHYENRKLITKIGGRDTSMGKFQTVFYNKRYLDGSYRYPYARENASPTDELLMQQARTGGREGQLDRYMCVNLTHDGGGSTAELRYFRSTTNILRFSGYLEWAHAVYHYTRNPAHELTDTGIITWIANHRSHYPNAWSIIQNEPRTRSEAYKGAPPANRNSWEV